MTAARWSDAELHKLDALESVPLRHGWQQFGRSKNAVRVMASRRRIERQRVEAARKARDLSRETQQGASP